VVGPYDGVYWRLVNTFIVGASLLFPVCGVILSFAFCGLIHPSLLHHRWCGVASLFILDSLFYIAELS